MAYNILNGNYIGADRMSALQATVGPFKARVAADAGTFEAETCLNQTVNRLRSSGLYDKASLILTPNAYKAAKLYSIKPTSGAGDLTFARAGVKRVRNAAGNWVEIGANVPPLHYPVGGGCPAWFPESQTTQLTPRSRFFNVGWSLTRLSAFGSGSVLNTPATPSVFGDNGAAYIQQASGQTTFGGLTRDFSVVSGTTYSISAYAKKGEKNFLVLVSNGQSGSFVQNYFNLDAGTIGTIGANHTASIVDEGNGWYRCTITFTANANRVATYGPHIGESNGTIAVNTQGGIFIDQVQVEAASTISSPIVNNTDGSLTRLADVPTASGISSLFGVTNTISVDFFVSTNRRGTLFEANNGTGANILRIDAESAGFLALTVFRESALITGVPATGASYLLNQWNRVVVIFNGSSYLVYLNNVLVLTVTNSNFPVGLNRIDYGQVRQVAGYWLNGFTRNLIVCPSVLSLAEINALSSI